MFLNIEIVLTSLKIRPIRHYLLISSKLVMLLLEGIENCMRFVTIVSIVVKLFPENLRTIPENL